MMEQDMRDEKPDKARRTTLAKVAIAIPGILSFDVNTLRAKASTTWTGGTPTAPK